MTKYQFVTETLIAVLLPYQSPCL